MKTVWRQDRGGMLAPKRRGNELLVEGYIAKPGVLEYKNVDGTITRELVTLETLRDSAHGLARAPVTLEHPPSDINPDNVQEYGVGDVDGEVVIQDDGYCRVKMAVRRRDAIDDVESGKRVELSPGYHAEIDETPGVHPEFGEYDAIQKARRYNHVAIVQDARGGSTVRIRTDGEDCAASEHLIAPRRDTAPVTPTNGARMRTQIDRICLALGVDPRRIDSDEAALEVAAEKAEKLREGSEEETTDSEMLATKDAEIADLKQRLEAAEEELDAIYADYEQEDMAALEPVAQDMGVEVEKNDSLATLVCKVADKMVGARRHDSQRERDVVAALALAEHAVRSFYARQGNSGSGARVDAFAPQHHQNEVPRNDSSDAPAALGEMYLQHARGGDR